MASERRIEKVVVLIREVTAEFLAREIVFPPGVMVTVTRVEPSGDLYYATVFISVFSANPAAEDATLAELKRMTGEIQHALNRKLRMRPVPRITFAIDEGEKRRERVEKLLSGDSDGG